MLTNEQICALPRVQRERADKIASAVFVRDNPSRGQGCLPGAAANAAVFAFVTETELSRELFCAYSDYIHATNVLRALRAQLSDEDRRELRDELRAAQYDV